ncbi:MAG TPA: hypothetical protein VHB27_01505 [Rhodopila sp.]|uniref:hypothetical protein n=1 Tax=Rhodopila sp. TaxID=2480087 RepID=UPI002B61F89C|nr:hypothetical protein [Rhodopila sp.]HVY13874.1 hypothetical protein [Rhodopila sp.]
MRIYRLLQVALQAESLRWRSMASRIVMRIIFACLSLVFLIGVLTFAHLAAWVWLRGAEGFNAYATAGILGGADLAIAVGFLLLASRSSPSRVELEALEVRRRALQSVSATFSLGQMAIPLFRIINSLLRRGRE